LFTTLLETTPLQEGKYNQIQTKVYNFEIISFGTSCINCKISMGANFDANQKSLCTFITFKPLEWTIFFFFKHFFLSNVHHSFNKIGENLNIDHF